MADKYLRQYEVLLKKAKADIAIATHALNARDSDIDTTTILFHFQQAAEKLLKALLSLNQVHFEKIHDISVLVDLCKNRGIPLPACADGFSELNYFAVIGRYDIAEEPDIDAQRFRQKLNDFRAFVESAIVSREDRGEQNR